jgi:hypothetical protein
MTKEKEKPCSLSILQDIIWTTWSYNTLSVSLSVCLIVLTLRTQKVFFNCVRSETIASLGIEVTLKNQ